MGAVNRFFTYEVTLGPMAAAGSDVKNFQVQAAYDFYWMKSEAFVYDANGLGVSTLQWPRISITLQDGSTTEQMTSQAAAVASIFGTGQIPFILPQPHLIVGGSNFSVTATNNHASIAYSVSLAFSGIHTFKGMPLQRAQLKRLR